VATHLGAAQHGENRAEIRLISVIEATMFTAKPRQAVDKDALYAELAEELAALLAGESDAIASTANMAALIFDGLSELNWAGFYFARGADLVLGPFQGKPACVRIPFGKGVCGTAATQRRSLLVADVNAFPGHIACDTASRSELVVPIIEGEEVIGVLDLDSAHLARFDEADRRGCEALVAVLLDHLRRHPAALDALRRA
jgi:GAF domain-containing protein